MKYDEKMIVISIRDMFFHILHHLKSILLTAIAGALIFCGYSIIKAGVPYLFGQDIVVKEEYYQQLETYKVFKEETEKEIATLTNSLEAATEYKDNSILYNAINTITARRVYLLAIQSPESVFESGLPENTDEITLLYQINLLNDCNIDELKELFGTDKKQYISEVVSVSVEDEKLLILQILGLNENTVEEQMNYISAVLETATHDKIQEIIPHELQFVDEMKTVEIDNERIDNQKKFDDCIASMKKSIDNHQQELEKTKEPEFPKNNIIKTILKNTLIGFVAGGILSIVFYMFSYVLSGKLHTAMEMETGFSLPVYGDYVSHQTKGLFSRLFNKWEFHGANADDAAISKSICSLLHETCAGKKLVLLGTVSENLLSRLQTSLQELVEDDITISIVPDFLNNSNGIVDAKKADAIVLVEKKQYSKIKEIDRIISVLSIMRANVIGCIIM